MNTIYIKDSCCGIKIEFPDEYGCMLINDYKKQESILKLIKVEALDREIIIEVCFNSLGVLTDSRRCSITGSEYSYIMKTHKTNIKSYHYYSTNNPGINGKCNYKDDEYLTDQLEPINAVLNNHGFKIGAWFIKSDIACSKFVCPTVGEGLDDLTEYIPNRKMLNARARNIINSTWGYSNIWNELNRKKAYNKRIFLEIKNIIINDPATIILWNDGTKTVVKCQPDDTFDPEKGIAMAILKKLYGNGGFYKDIFEPAIEKYELKKSLEKSKNHVAKKKEKKSTIK